MKKKQKIETKVNILSSDYKGITIFIEAITAHWSFFQQKNKLNRFYSLHTSTESICYSMGSCLCKECNSTEILE